MRRPPAKMRLVPRGQIELVDRGAAFLDLHAVLGDVAERADAGIELLAVRARQQAPRPMPAGLERDELASLGGDAVRARDIRKGDHAVGVADIEGVADQRHAERLAQPFHENPASFGDAVAVGVAQQRDAVGADAERRGAPHRRLHRIVEHAPAAVRRSAFDSAMSTSPLGSTLIQRGWSRPVANALTLSPGAAVGFCPSLQPWAVGILSVGMAPCGFASGIAGALPQAGAGAAPCIRRHSSATAPISATMRAKIPTCS